MKAENEKEIKELLGENYEEFKMYAKTSWVGAFTIDDLLSNCLNSSFAKPPESNSVYLVSRGMWYKRPTSDCIPLYVGSNISKSPRFRERIGDLIADMFGLFYHHSGGQSIHCYCKEENLNPKELYIGWLERCGCMRCAENYYYKLLEPKLNINKPTKCKEHNNPYSAVIS